MQATNKVHTAPGHMVGDPPLFVVDRPAWRQSRYAAVVRYFVVRGYGLDLARALGFKLMPLLARETGSGEEEHNFDVGNLRPGSTPDAPGVPGWHGDYDVRTHGKYRAYTSLDDGVADFIDLVRTSHLYGALWLRLETTDDVAGWYESIIRRGYYPLSADPATAAREVIEARSEYERLYAQMKAAGLTYTPPGGTVRLLSRIAAFVRGPWLRDRITP